jgi:hypothetical protein
VLSSSAFAQTTWYVDGPGCDGAGTGTEADPFCTIQEALDAAASGDSIHVLRGTYQENLRVPALELDLHGELDAEHTILLGAPDDEWPSVPAITVAPGANLVLGNLTVRRGSPGILSTSSSVHAEGCRLEDNHGLGYPAGGGAVWGTASDLTFRQCEFDSNSGDLGGALFVVGGSLTLEGSTFSGNCGPWGGSILIRGGVLNASGCAFSAATCKSVRGGAIFSTGSRVNLDACSFREFSSGEAYGIVMWAEDSELDVHASVFEDNYSSQGWGAINLQGCSSQFVGCRFERNRSSAGQLEGGALYVLGSRANTSAFADCRFIDNWSAEGGAVLAEGATVSFERCWFRGNRAFSSDRYGHGDGGAVASWNADVHLDHCVLVDNHALGFTYRGTPGRGGAVMGPATLESCTLFLNSASSSSGGNDGDGGGAFDCTLNSCILRANLPNSLGGRTLADWCDVAGGWSGTGNFDADPLFWGPEHSDFDLLPTSPCIDTGDPTRTDDDGSRLDVGAFAFDPDFCGFPGAYCRSKENSAGCLPAIASSGLPALSGPHDFHVLASNVLSHQLGLLLFSTTGAADEPFLGGTLCMALPIARFSADRSTGGGGCNGTFDFRITKGYLHSHHFEAGTRLYFQIWYRDPQHLDGTGTGLTDGLEATICLGH